MADKYCRRNNITDILLSAHPVPEYTSIVIRQTSPTSTMLQKQHQDIEEVAIESLPEMVTELFESIPNQSLASSLPISQSPSSKRILTPTQIKLEPQFQGNYTNSPIQTLSPLAVSTSTVQQLPSPVLVDANGNNRQFIGTPLIKSYHQNGFNNQNQETFNTIKRLPEFLPQAKISPAQTYNGLCERPIILPQNESFYSSQSTLDVSKKNEPREIDLENSSLSSLIEEDKTRATEAAQVGLDDIQFLTDILQSNIDDQTLKTEPLKSVDSSVLLDSMDVPLYADINQYSSNQNSFEIAYKDEDMNETEADKNDDQGVIGSSSWDTSSSVSSSASSIGSHFEFSYSQDFSDMVSSDFGVSDIIDWGLVT